MFSSFFLCQCGGNFVGKSSGGFVCAHCDLEVHEDQGILRFPFLLGTSHEDQSIAKGQAARDLDAKIYDLKIQVNLAAQLEKIAFQRWLKDNSRKVGMEFGCGTGRLTALGASYCEHLVAVDYSFESLLACKRKLEKAGLIDRVTLVQADVSRLKLRPNSLELAFSAQVVQHLPTEELRKITVSTLHSGLKEGAQLYASLYHFEGLLTVFMHREGEHKGGMYYKRFTKKDVEELMSPYFLPTQSHVEACYLNVTIANRVTL